MIVTVAFACTLFLLQLFKNKIHDLHRTTPLVPNSRHRILSANCTQIVLRHSVLLLVLFRTVRKERSVFLGIVPVDKTRWGKE